MRARWCIAGACVVCAAVAACSETRRPLGEDCLKDVDCLSGVCSGLKCAAAPPFLDGAPPPTPDAGSDASGSDASGADASGDAPASPDGASSDVSVGG